MCKHTVVCTECQNGSTCIYHDFQSCTHIWSTSECHPHYLPNIIFLFPSPVGRALCIHLTSSCLAPDTGSLISCTLDMFYKRCPGWWYYIIGPLLPRKQLESCIVNPISIAVLVIHSNNKLFICYWRVLTELLGHLRHHFPGLP